MNIKSKIAIFCMVLAGVSAVVHAVCVPNRHRVGTAYRMNHKSCVSNEKRFNVSVAAHANCFSGAALSSQHCWDKGKELTQYSEWYSDSRCTKYTRTSNTGVITVRTLMYIDCSKDDGKGSGAKE